MVKTVLTFLIIVSFIFAGLGYAALFFQDNHSSFTLPFYTTPTPTIPAPASLTLSPEGATVMQQQINTIDIVFESPNNTDYKPKIIQLEIAYDPLALGNVAITPGDFFTNPTIALDILDTNTGRISYALQSSTVNQKTKGIVARLTFTPNPAFSSLQTPVSFLGKTMIRGITNENILTQTVGTQLLFATPSAKQN